MVSSLYPRRGFQFLNEPARFMLKDRLNFFCQRFGGFKAPEVKLQEC